MKHKAMTLTDPNWKTFIQYTIKYSTTVFDIALPPKLNSAHTNTHNRNLLCQAIVNDEIALSHYTVL